MDTAREITARLGELLRREQGAMADFLVELAAFDAKRLWLELGHPSLFYFLHRELGLSKGAAHYRKTAAELVQKFPEVVEPLRGGKLCITSIVHLAKVLTPENRHEMLPRFFHRSRREAMEVAAAVKPAEAAPRREVVTPVRTGRTDAAAEAARPAGDLFASREPAVQLVEPIDRAQVAARLAPPSASAPEAAPPPPPSRDTAEPVTQDLFRLHLTFSRRALAKLEAARDALSHARPGASMGEILEAGLDLLLEQHAKRKGLVAKPRKEPPPSDPHSRHVPAHVRRAVWIRDGGRCQFSMGDGRICGSTYQVELDHIDPWALGGPTTVEKMRLACRGHNQLAARRVFGDAWMDRFARKERAPPAGGP
jgi:hypothetical protein